MAYSYYVVLEKSINMLCLAQQGRTNMVSRDETSNNISPSFLHASSSVISHNPAQELWSARNQHFILFFSVSCPLSLHHSQIPSGPHIHRSPHLRRSQPGCPRVRQGDWCLLYHHREGYWSWWVSYVQVKQNKIQIRLHVKYSPP